MSIGIYDDVKMLGYIHKHRLYREFAYAYFLDRG